MRKFFGLAAALLLTGVAAHAAQAPAVIDNVKVTDLGNKTYMLQMQIAGVDQGGNITVAVGDDGIIQVDANFAQNHDKIKAAVAAISPLPVKYVINTHMHGDHTGGDAAFSADGATVVAHENVKKRLSEGTTNGLTGAKTAPAAPEGLPKQTYADKTTLMVKGRTVQIGHPMNAHTDGDSYAYFADANVVATGDVVTLGRYPNIDFANGGGINGMIAGVDAYLAMGNDQTKFVPGHGNLATKADLRAYRQMLADARTAVQKLIDEGKTIDEAVAAKPNAASDTKLGANEMAAGNWVRVIYSSLKK